MLRVIMRSVNMLNVTYKPFMLNVSMLSVIMLNVVMLSVVANATVTKLIKHVNV
jgi:hypothetical protein